MKHGLILAAALVAFGASAGAAYAQETPSQPDTSVRNLEAPTDIRGKQLRSQERPDAEQGRSIYQNQPDAVQQGAPGSEPRR